MVALDAVQVQLAICKVQRSEEDKNTAGSEFMNLFKVAPTSIADSITKLDTTARAFARTRQTTLALWPVSAAKYDIEDVATQVKALWDKQITATLTAWSNALIKAETKLVGCLPKDWEKFARDDYDNNWVIENFLTPTALKNIGTGYTQVQAFVDTLDEQYAEISERMEAEQQTTIIACLLTYLRTYVFIDWPTDSLYFIFF